MKKKRSRLVKDLWSPLYRMKIIKNKKKEENKRQARKRVSIQDE